MSVDAKCHELLVIKVIKVIERKVIRSIAVKGLFVPLGNPLNMEHNNKGFPIQKSYNYFRMLKPGLSVIDELLFNLHMFQV